MEIKKYFEERIRMLNSYGRIKRECDGVNCHECPFNKKDYGCNLNTLESVDIVEKWSKEHPQKTMLQDLLEKYPNIQLNDRGIPRDLCPHSLGYSKGCRLSNCITCWNRPLEEEKNE